jgi:outer membrane protein assembly factor BamB
MHSFSDKLNINQSPAVANGTIYLTAFVPGYGSVIHPDTSIYAFDAQTGAQKWVRAKMRGYVNGPTVLNDKVCAMSYDGIWYILNPSNGAIESQKTLANTGISAPIASNGVLYSITDTTLAVLNPDGSAKWSVPVAGKYPLIDDVKGGIIYVSGRGSGIYAYSATNGSLLWHYEGYLPQPDGVSLATIVG